MAAKTRTIAVASGKGGVGKTTLTACLAWILAEQGRKVCLVDVDVGLSNLDVLLGISPQHTLEDVILKGMPIEQAITNVRPGLDIISGGSGIAALADMNKTKRTGFLNKIKSLDNYDFLLLDNAPGIHRQVVAFCLAAKEQIIVVNPEPTSVTDGYALFKVLRQNGLRLPPYVLLNRVPQGFDHAMLLKRFGAVCKKHLDALILPLGAIPEDTLFRHVATRSVLPVAYRPKAPSSLALSRVASLIVKRMAPATLHSDVEGFWTASLFTMFQGLHLPEPGPVAARPKAHPPTLEIVLRLERCLEDLGGEVNKAAGQDRRSIPEGASEMADRLARIGGRLLRIAETWKNSAHPATQSTTAKQVIKN